MVIIVDQLFNWMRCLRVTVTLEVFVLTSELKEKLKKSKALTYRCFQGRFYKIKKVDRDNNSTRCEWHHHHKLTPRISHWVNLLENFSSFYFLIVSSQEIFKFMIFLKNLFRQFNKTSLILYLLISLWKYENPNVSIWC